MVYKSEEGNISYSDKGSGKTIILIHGYLETAQVWDDFARKLSRHFRVITVDLPGHGESAQSRSPLTVEVMATIVKELIDYLRPGKVFMTGHSLGGYVTLAFVDLFPDGLSGYCLFHSQPLADTPETVEKRMREIAMIKDGKKELFYPENVSRMFATANLEKFGAALRRAVTIAGGISDNGIVGVLNAMMVRPSRLNVMEEGRVPCLWILGAGDNYIPCTAVQSKVKLPVNAKFVLLENSGHLGFVEEEALALEAITEFVRGLD